MPAPNSADSLMAQWLLTRRPMIHRRIIHGARAPAANGFTPLEQRDRKTIADEPGEQRVTTSKWELGKVG